LSTRITGNTSVVTNINIDLEVYINFRDIESSGTLLCIRCAITIV